MAPLAIGPSGGVREGVFLTESATISTTLLHNTLTQKPPWLSTMFIGRAAWGGGYDEHLLI